MLDLTPDEQELVATLGAACPPLVPVGEFPAALIRRARARGLIEEWPDCPGIGRAILLSWRVASALGLILSDAEIDKARWVRADSDRLVRSSAVAGDGPGGIPDGPSDAMSALDTLIAREEAIAELSRPAGAKELGGSVAALAAGLGPGRGMPKLPVILIGSTRPDWSPTLDPLEDPPVAVTPRPAGSPCPVCRGRKLEAIEACLGCLKSGVDDRLPKVPDHEKPRRKAAPAAAKKAIAGGKGGKRRRAG